MPQSLEVGGVIGVDAEPKGGGPKAPVPPLWPLYPPNRVLWWPMFFTAPNLIGVAPTLTLSHKWFYSIIIKNLTRINYKINSQFIYSYESISIT